MTRDGGLIQSLPLFLPPVVHVVLRACRGHGHARPRRHGRRRGGQLVEPEPERLLNEDSAAHALGPTLIQPLVTDLLSVKGFLKKNKNKLCSMTCGRALQKEQGGSSPTMISE